MELIALTLALVVSFAVGVATARIALEAVLFLMVRLIPRIEPARVAARQEGDSILTARA